MKNPKVALECIKLICEIEGDFKSENNLNIQVNNIMDEVQRARMLELTRGNDGE
jgi:hypothetical protein